MYHTHDSPVHSLEYAIERMKISSLLQRFVGTLSMGQRRIISFARLLASPCPLWFLDEPTIALDIDAVSRLEEIIQEHRDDGGIVVVASHTNIKLSDAVSLRFASSPLL